MMGSIYKALAGRLTGRREVPRGGRAPSPLRAIALAATSLVAIAAVQPAAQASSHREAPMIAGMPRFDATDFFMFRSYETGRSAYVTLIADYLPLQDPAGGPNFFNLATDGYYDINIDNQGTGMPAFAYRFRFTTIDRNIALNINGKNVPIALINAGQITSGTSQTQNVIQTYTISLVTFNARGKEVKEEILKDANSGGGSFQKPQDNIGDKSIPNYAEYMQLFMYQVKMGTCGNGRVFVGQRKDPFVVNLGETFDLVNYANPVGEQYAASEHDDLAGKNVTSFVFEVPAACLTNGGSGSSSVGAWTTSSQMTGAGNGPKSFTQVSRLANPLVNELVIGLKDKDTFNGSLPANDGQFATYVTNPTVPALIEALFGTKAPTLFPRSDLVAVFLTGVTGVNATGGKGVAAEEMRLNTTSPITPYGSQNRLGVIAGDNAGYPNGRRPGDDVVDITLRVAMGKLISLGLFGTPAQAPSGNLEFTDGAFTDSTHFLQVFPYLMPPLSSSPQSAGSVPVAAHEPN